MVVLVAVVLCLLIMGLPYSLYLDSQQLAQPVVVFRARIWRVLPSVLPVLVFNGMILVLACLLVARPAYSPAALPGGLALALVSLGLFYVALRLHISYWLHDRHAMLAIYRDEQQVDYQRDGAYLRFALADVVQITRYISSSRGLYSYQVFALQDGTELLLTCLMYSMLGPQELMPAAHYQTVHLRRICWLPGQEPRFFNLF